MEKDFVEKYRKLWDEWEVRGCILFSLFLQIFLVFSASWRKQKTTGAKFFRPIIWLAYLTADAVAMFALGLLSDSLDPSSRHSISKSLSPAAINDYNDLIAFWAPFLLLHLGGPDTITAFALEDNELWLRHMLWLCVEVIVACYIFVRSLPNKSLWIPTLFMFVAGTVRYAERTWALYLASNDGFKDSILKAVDPGTNYSKLIDEYTVNKDAGLHTKISIPEEFPSVALKNDSENKSRDEKMEKMAAYEFFTKFKCLIFDLLINFNDRKQSYNFRGDAIQAFKIMDIELGFAYDILYTKAAVVHTSIGYITRAICFTSVLASFLFFKFFPKHGILKSDVKITYALLGGAMVLDVVALFYLIFSDWTFIILQNHRSLGLLRDVIGKNIPCRRRLQSKCVTQYNLINSRYFKYKHCNGHFREKLSESWLINRILVNFFYISDTSVDDKLKKFIFEELKEKAEGATDPEKSKILSSFRGCFTLKKSGHYEKLKWTVEEVEFVESILLWHIATDLSYHKDKKNEAEADETEKSYRDISKVISEYMVYLLVVHPSMISSLEGVKQVKFRDVCQETMSIIKAKRPKDEDAARDSLVGLSKEMTERTKKVSMDACYLVKILSDMEILSDTEILSGKKKKWETVSKVWAELLAYAARQCRGNYHAKCLSSGGELLTHVWLLMAHLGMGHQYHVASSHAKVIVEK